MNVFQLLGLIRAPGFNRLPMAGEEVVMSYMSLSDMSNQATDILYTISVAGTLVFAVNDIVSEEVITASDDALFEAVTDIAPTVFFGTVNVYERIYHCLREMKRSTSGFQRLVSNARNMHFFIELLARREIFRTDALPNFAKF